MATPERSLISCTYQAEVAKGSSQRNSPSCQVLRQLKSQPCQVSYVKIRLLIWKQGHSQNWNGYIGEDFIDLQYLKLLIILTLHPTTLTASKL